MALINFSNSEGNARFPFIDDKICAIKVDFNEIKLMNVGTITNSSGNYNFAACPSDNLMNTKNNILMIMNFLKNQFLYYLK